MRSDSRAATRLMIALVTPKLTMNDVMAVFELRPNSCSPRSGSTVRSRPTMAPTKALRTTSSENCGRFSRSPSRDLAHSPVRLRRRFSAKASGCGGRSFSTKSTNSALRGELQRRVETTLEADRGAGLAAQTFAARRAAEMGGKDLEVVGQRQELAVQAVVELLGERRFGARAEQIRAADPAREQRIAGQHEPGFRRPRLVGDQDRDAVRRVSRRVEDREHHVAKIVSLPILDVDVRERRPGPTCGRAPAPRSRRRDDERPER